jgi:hypothetical protein
LNCNREEKNNAISKEDMDIYSLVDTADEAFLLIKKMTDTKNQPLIKNDKKHK